MGGAVIASLLYAKPYGWIAVVAVGVLLGTLEVTRRLRAAGFVIPVIPLVLGGQATVWLTWPFRAGGALAGFGGTVLVCMMWRLLSRHGHGAARGDDTVGPTNYLRDVSATVFLAAWVPLFASFAALLIYPDGAGRAFSLALGVVCSDVGGYAMGVLFGKHPMVPAISPKSRGRVLRVLWCLGSPRPRSA